MKIFKAMGHLDLANEEEELLRCSEHRLGFKQDLSYYLSVNLHILSPHQPHRWKSNALDWDLSNLMDSKSSSLVHKESNHSSKIHPVAPFTVLSYSYM